jgi:cellulose synthase operon protein C
VARSAELKERALRRRASAVVSDLWDAWSTREAADRAEAATQSDRAHAAARAATRVERDADGIADRLATSLGPHAAAWARDLELVFIGRDPEAAAHDPVLARYRVDRAVAAIAPALTHALTAIVPEVDLPPARLAPRGRAVVRAAAWSAPAHAPEMLAAIAQASVATLVEQLLAMSVAPAPSTATQGVLRELSAFRAALGS